MRLDQIKGRHNCVLKVVFVDGFWTQDISNPVDWKETLTHHYEKASWHYLRWASGTVASFCWQDAKDEALEAGKFLAKKILEDTDSEYILFGYSLGARVVFHTLSNLRLSSIKNIQEVNLLGGAVTSDGVWSDCLGPVSGKINNYYSQNDKILKKLYVKLGRSKIPAGVRPIKLFSPRINNINVSDYVMGHHDYIESYCKYKISENNPCCQK
jgi:hypothetical protein